MLHHHTVFLPSNSVKETESCRPWNGRDQDHASGPTDVGKAQASASNRERKVQHVTSPVINVLRSMTSRKPAIVLPRAGSGPERNVSSSLRCSRESLSMSCSSHLRWLSFDTTICCFVSQGEETERLCSATNCHRKHRSS